jgi:hypothetical protein
MDTEKDTRPALVKRDFLPGAAIANADVNHVERAHLDIKREMIMTFHRRGVPIGKIAKAAEVSVKEVLDIIAESKISHNDLKNKQILTRR